MNDFLHSVKASEGAERLEKKMNEGILQLDILPNSYEQFSGELERKDYISYCSFLKSRNGLNVLSMLEEEEMGFIC